MLINAGIYSQKLFTLHLLPRNAHKQGVSRGEELLATLHPLFTTRKRLRVYTIVVFSFIRTFAPSF